MLCAEISESRIATNARPVGDRSRFRIANVAATASTNTCAAGIASVGVYTAPGVLAYVQNGATLDTSLPLSAGTYNTVVQAWDNCGGALKMPITISVQ